MTVPAPKFILLTACSAIAFLATLAAPAGSAAASSWTLRQLPARQLQGGAADEAGLSGVSCPTESLCVAVGALHTLATSTAPTAGAAAWHVVNPTGAVEPGKNCNEDGAPGPPVPCSNYLKGALTAVSCASEELCVAVGFEGAVDVSADPTGGASAWSMSNVNVKGGGSTHLTGVSCPSASLCVAVAGRGSGGSAGKILTSTDPLSGRWQVTQLDSSLDLRGVSCATPSLCVAVAKEGRIVTSTDPAGGAPAWQEAQGPGGAGDLEGVSCIAAPLCAAGNATGNILTSTDPTGSGSTWSTAKAGGAALITGISCSPAKGCVAVDNNGSVLTSTDPTAGPASWQAESLVPFEASPGEGQFPHNALFAASCASTSLCVLVGSESRIFTSTAPFSVATNAPGSGSHHAHGAGPRPQTKLVFAEDFWPLTYTRRHRVRARFHFYSPTRVRGFECKRDGGPWRTCRSPLRYWVAPGRHALRVRAIGPTGLHGPAAIRRFRVLRPIHHPRSPTASRVIPDRQLQNVLRAAG